MGNLQPSPFILQPTVRILLALLCWCTVGALPGRAQPKNLTLFQDLAVSCLAAAPDTVQAFRLTSADRMPYLRTALVGRWQENGRVVFLPDSSRQAPALPHLQYRVETAQVTYERAGRKKLRRTVTLALHHTLTAADGRLLQDARCTDRATDTIRRADLAAVQTDAFPETLGAIPEAGGLRRYLEPAVLTAVTVIGTYLFFSLRSSRADDGGG